MSVAFTSIRYARKFSGEDAAKVALAAKHVLLIDTEGNILSHKTNKSFVLDLIAVIGPSTYRGEEIKTACLLEIGFKRSRPYKQTRRFAKNRRRYCKINAVQLAHCWHKIEEIIVDELDKRTAGWKSRSGWIYYGRIKSRCISAKPSRKKEVKHYRQRGIYVCLSQQDEEVVSVFLRSEIVKRQICLKKDMCEVAQIAKSLLNDSRLLDDKFLKRSLKKDSTGVSIFVDLLAKRRLRPHQIYFLLKYCSRTMRQILTSILLYLKYDLDRVARFGRVCEREGYIFEQDVFLYARPLLNHSYITFEISRPPENFVPWPVFQEKKASL